MEHISTYLNLFTGIGECCMFVYVNIRFLNETRTREHIRRGYYILAFILNLLPYFLLLEITNYWVIGIMGLQLVLNTVTGYLLFYKKIMMIFYSIIFFASIYAVTTAVKNLLLGVMALFPNKTYSLNYYTGIMLINAVIVVMVGHAVTDYLKKRIYTAYSLRQLLFSSLLCACSLILHFMIYMTSSLITTFFSAGFFFVSLNCAVITVFNLLAGGMMGIRRRNQELNLEISMFRSQSKLQYNHYKELEAKYDNSRKLIHDIRNHLLAVESLYDIGEKDSAKSYAEDIHQKLNEMGQEYYCDHPLLNIILCDKIERAKKAGIEGRVYVGDVTQRLGQIKDIDITTIFANLLDNALEAAGAVTEDSYIQVKVDQFHDFLVIDVVNTKKQLNSYQAGKKSGSSGIGLKNIKSVLEIYNGTMEIEEQEDQYHVNIVIP